MYIIQDTWESVQYPKTRGHIKRVVKEAGQRAITLIADMDQRVDAYTMILASKDNDLL